MNVLIIKYNIKPTLIQRDKTKSQYRIYISKSSMNIVKGLVKPYSASQKNYEI